MISNTIAQHLLKVQNSKVQEGYINATLICKATNKSWSNYFKLNSTKAKISKVADSINIPKSKLVLTTEGGIPNLQGTWIHPELLPDLISWCNSPPNNGIEKQVQATLSSYIPGAKREVKTPVGKIDILTSEEIIEVKEAKYWITAVGQLLVYGLHYPLHKKRLHLFGELTPSLLATIEDYCLKFNIVVTSEL